MTENITNPKHSLNITENDKIIKPYLANFYIDALQILIKLIIHVIFYKSYVYTSK